MSRTPRSHRLSACLSTTKRHERKATSSLGLLAHLLRFGAWGGCRGGLTTEPEDMGQEPYRASLGHKEKEFMFMRRAWSDLLPSPTPFRSASPAVGGPPLRLARRTVWTRVGPGLSGVPNWDSRKGKDPEKTSVGRINEGTWTIDPLVVGNMDN